MLSDELITKIAADLDVLPLQPTSRRELELLVSRISVNIRAAQERGATYTEIAGQISASGYPIKRSTLCAALMRHRKNAAGVKHPARRRQMKSSSAQIGAGIDIRPAGDDRSYQTSFGDTKHRRQSAAVSSH